MPRAPYHTAPRRAAPPRPAPPRAALSHPTQANAAMLTSGVCDPNSAAPYVTDFNHPKKVCKASNWHVESLPRIYEDGRVCGGLSYYMAQWRNCFGQPGAQVRL